MQLNPTTTRLRFLRLCGIVAATVSLPAWGQTTLEKVEVTGSSIKRIETEEPGPVEIYSRRDIERSGAATISDFLKNIASLDVFDEADTGGSPISGSGKIMMRGLSARNVLVLLNGRRVPSAPIQDNSGNSAAFDINNLPLSAIDRIEVLKDGGSAIYGADAVVGVVNFITRRNYTGTEAWGRYGQASRGDAKERTGGLTFGSGEFAADGFNLMGSLDLYKRDPVKRTARDITKSSDWTRFAGGNGVDGRSPYHPVGNIYDPNTGMPIGQIRPCPQPTVNGECLYDTNAEGSTDAINGAERISGMLNGRWRLDGKTTAFAELLMSQSKARYEIPILSLAYELPSNDIVAVRPAQLGPRTTERRSDLTNLVVGLEGQAGQVDWDVAAGHGRTSTSLHDSNFASFDATYTAIGNGSFDPTSTTNPDAVMNAIRLNPRREAEGTNSYLNGKATGTLMQLADGPLAYAFGGSLNRETLVDRPDADLASGNVLGAVVQTPVDASRQFQAVFGELSLPLAPGFEALVALRYDRYNSVRSADGQGAKSSGRASPRMALRYQAASSVLLRASYAENFLQPTLRQLFGGAEQTNGFSDDPSVCSTFPGAPCPPLDYTWIIRSSPELKPETGRTTGFGIVFEPSRSFSIGIDYFMIRKRNEIVPQNLQTAIDNGQTGVQFGQAIVYSDLVNVLNSTVSGTDVDLRGRIVETPWGVLSVRDTFTYYHEVSRQQAGGVVEQYVGTLGTPQWRNVLGLNLSSGPWSTSANLRMVAHMLDSVDPDSDRLPNTRTIESHSEVDLQVEYTGVKGVTLTGGIQNLFDTDVPYSSTATSSAFGATGFAPMYSPRGRFFYMGLRYAFR
jgi:iron complex outermembrane receptor protein